MAVFRRLALIFALIIVVIILTADLGLARSVFGPIYAFPYGDKIAHFLLMGALSLLVNLGFRSGRLPMCGLPLSKASLLLAFIITIEEASQVFLDNRDFSLFDLAANYAGIFLLGELGALLRGLLFPPKTPV